MPNFYETKMGRNFFEGQVPRIADGIESVNTSIEKLTALMKRQCALLEEQNALLRNVGLDKESVQAETPANPVDKYDMDNFKYWSNSVGDLFNPTRAGIDSWETVIQPHELPKELQHAYYNLWTDSCGSNCRLVEYAGRYGIALTNEYEPGAEEMIEGRAQETVKLLKDKGIPYLKACADEEYRELIVVLPWDVSREDFEKVTDFLYETAYKKDITYEDYKEHKEEDTFIKEEDNFRDGHERVFWMNRNISGLNEEGCPMTLEHLKKVFEGRGVFDVEAFLAGDTTKEMEGAFYGDDTFTIHEVSSLIELRDLMTWKDFDPQQSHASGDLCFEYPDFVHEDLRLSRYIYEFTGYTTPYLPASLDYNPTLEKYAEMFGYSKEEYFVKLLKYEPTEKDKAMKQIADVLQNGTGLDVDDYNVILKDRGLEDYIAEQEHDKEKESSEISEGILNWHIIHDADDDNGQPTQWSATLPNGEYLWIDREDEGYALYDTYKASARPVSVSATLDEAMEKGEDYALELSVMEDMER